MKNRAPLVSITLDDAPDSAYVNGASILEEYGIRGTYYIAAGICDTKDTTTHWHMMTPEQVLDLHNRGHEIACHTFSHVDVQTINATRVDEECKKNVRKLRQICGDLQLTNFAYPYGHVSLLHKLNLQKRFETCRGVYEGVNIGNIDLGLLKVVELFDRTLTPEKLQRVLRETSDRNGWLIFFTHDVVDSPSVWGCSPDLLRSTIETIQEMGLTCVPIRDAIKQIGYFNN